MVGSESPTKQFLELPDTEFIFVKENFLPMASELRWCYEERCANFNCCSCCGPATACKCGQAAPRCQWAHP